MSKSKYAYVFAMFLGDGYLLGVLTMAYSIFKTKTKYDVVCMVTPDVSEDAKSKMKHIGIRVIDIDYIYTNPYFYLRPDIKKRYPHVEKFSTKWTCLNLTEYKKVFLLDVDMIVQRNIDHIFKLPAPATRIVLHAPTNTSHAQSGIYGSFIMEDGDELPDDIADTFIYKKGGAIDGGCLLLKPNKKIFKKLLKYLKNFDIRKTNAVMGDDEISLFSFYVQRQTQWHYLGIRWSCKQWKYKGLCSLSDSLILNFAGVEKPWVKNLSTYTDLKKWYLYYGEMKKEYPDLIAYKF